MLSFSQFIFIGALVSSLAGTRLVAKSVTVDDADATKIIYSTGWNIGNKCLACFAKPNETQAYEGTWHDGTASGSTNLSFTFTFTGTSIEARYIAIDIIDTTTQFTTGTNVSYSIDGVQSGTVARNPATLDTYIYNHSLFSVTGLANIEHTLRVVLLKPSVLLLDYLVYDDGDLVTSPTVTSSTSSVPSTPNATGSTSSVPLTPNDTSSTYSTNLGATIGGVMAAFIILVLVVLAWCFFKRRRTPRRGTQPILRSQYSALTRPQFLPSNARPMSVAATTQIAQPFKLQQLASSETATALKTNLFPTLAPSSLVAMTNPRSIPSVPEAHQWTRFNEKSPFVMSPYSGQGATTDGAPPSSFYTNVVANRVRAEILDEPVEEDSMSRRPSMRSTLPPYSPGGFQHDEDVPPLPQR